MGAIGSAPAASRASAVSVRRMRPSGSGNAHRKPGDIQVETKAGRQMTQRVPYPRDAVRLRGGSSTRYSWRHPSRLCHRTSTTGTGGSPTQPWRTRRPFRSVFAHRRGGGCTWFLSETLPVTSPNATCSPCADFAAGRDLTCRRECRRRPHVSPRHERASAARNCVVAPRRHALAHRPQRPILRGFRWRTRRAAVRPAGKGTETETNWRRRRRGRAKRNRRSGELGEWNATGRRAVPLPAAPRTGDAVNQTRTVLSRAR